MFALGSIENFGFKRISFSNVCFICALMNINDAYYLVTVRLTTIRRKKSPFITIKCKYKNSDEFSASGSYSTFQVEFKKSFRPEVIIHTQILNV